MNANRIWTGLVMGMMLAAAAGLVSRAQEATKAPAKDKEELRMAVGLTDTSMLLGKATITHVKVQTDFGPAEVPLKYVVAITMVDQKGYARLDFRNGDRVTGLLALPELKLDSLIGRVTIERQHIATILLTRGDQFGLVLYYKFDQPGEKVKDFSGMGNEGTVHGAVFCDVGRIGGAYRFDGESSFVSAANAESLNPPKFTIAAWVYPETMPDYATVIMKAPPDEWTSGFGLCQFADGNKMHFFVNNESDQHIGTGISLKRWNHLVATFDGENMRLYVNGQLRSNGPSGGVLRHHAGSLRIGNGSGDTYPWHGLIDEVMIYNRALSDLDVRSLYLEQNARSRPEKPAPIPGVGEDDDDDDPWGADGDPQIIEID